MVGDLVTALRACAVTIALCAAVYPLVVWSGVNVLFPRESEGSIVRDSRGTIVGSMLIAQSFSSEVYFKSRPSAVQYDAMATGGSNLGSKNPELHRLIGERAHAVGATNEHPAPADLVMASGSGVDPHISIDAAIFQMNRVAAARGMDLERVRSAIESCTDRSGAIVGSPPRINVLQLNLALDALSKSR
jgi:K+-transporting ATPase ATPase C chain